MRNASRGFASVGAKLPSVELHKGFPPEKINVSEYCKDKNVILLGLPGAFTPTWSTKQIPGYLEKQDELRELGVETIIVYAVNDGAVMQGWAKDQRASLSSLQFMGDPAGDLTKALDMDMDHPGPESLGLYGRCKRNAIHAVNGEIKIIRISASPNDPAGGADPSTTLAESMIEAIKKQSS